MPFPAFLMLKLFLLPTESSPRDSIPPVAVPFIEGSNSSVLEITQLLPGQLENGRSADSVLTVEVAAGSVEAGLLLSALSAAKKGQKAARGETMVRSLWRLHRLQQSLTAKGRFSLFFTMSLLCWHHNTSGGRERTREKMNVLVSG